MADLFADTSGWGNLVDHKQTFHSLATTTYRAARRQGRKIVTTSFVVMSRRAILEALTTDHHFEQAGFVRLLK